MTPVVILGGGLAGLGAAYFLKQPWTLVEKSARVGGLIKTEDIDGFLFDPTGHWLHLRDPEVKQLVHEVWLLDEEEYAKVGGKYAGTPEGIRRFAELLDMIWAARLLAGMR